MRIGWLAIAMLAPMAQAVAQGTKPLSEGDESLPPRYASRYCEIAASVALPKIPNLEIVEVRTNDVKRLPAGGALKRPDYAYSMTVEIVTKALGRTERFITSCNYDVEQGARVLPLQIKL